MLKDIPLTTIDNWNCDRCGRIVIIKGVGWEFIDEEGNEESFSLCSDCITQLYTMVGLKA